MIKSKLSYNLILFWLLVWAWNTKFIFQAATTNYLEIAFYLSSFLLLIPLSEAIIRIFKTNRFNTKDTKTRPLWWWGVIIIFLVGSLSIVWAVDRSLALTHWFSLVASLVIFVLILKSPSPFKKRAAKIFLLGLLLPALLGLFQFSFQFAPASKYLGLATHNSADLGASVIETSAGRFLRAYGSFDHPNIFGGIIALAALLSFYLGLKEENKNLKIFFLITWLFFSAGLLVSFSRSAFLAFGLGLSTLIFTELKTVWQRGKLFLLSNALLLTIFISFFSPLLLVRINPEARLEEKSLTERNDLKIQAKTIICQQPLIGTGLGGYVPALMQINSSLEPWGYQPVHNYWLLVWAELGFFGFLGFALLWVGILKMSLKSRTWPLCLALLVLSFFDHWLFSQPVVPLAIFFILGFLSSPD